MPDEFLIAPRETLDELAATLAGPPGLVHFGLPVFESRDIPAGVYPPSDALAERLRLERVAETARFLRALTGGQ